MTRPAEPRASVTDHLANERTHLAYVRTAVALFAFGITLHQFSWFMSELSVLAFCCWASGWRCGRPYVSIR
ncbi:MAG TPA: DUF202 domain-containing protein [Povalibacter sp.]